jgi:hypothetical protein
MRQLNLYWSFGYSCLSSQSAISWLLDLFWEENLELDLQLTVQSVPITTKVVSSNRVHDEVYLIQHYVIKFVIDLRQVGGFLLRISIEQDFAS